MKNNSKNQKNQKKRKVPVVAVIFAWLLAIVAVSGVVAYALWNYEVAPMEKVEENVKVVKIKVPEGTSVTEISETLESEGLIRSAKFFYLVARLHVFDRSKEFSLKTGQYSFKNTMSLKQIYDLLQIGTADFVSVHIPEGLTIRKTANVLEENEVCDAQEFIAACYDREILDMYGIKAESCEGFLFPDTYYMTKKMSAKEAVIKLLDNFEFRISTIDKLAGKSFDEVYELVTLASIVEREYKVAKEAPIIASVFVNRLEHNIGLYSCATIEYIITEIRGKPHPETIFYIDLKYDNPYNTYMYKGLPPGPISNPGMVALEATANPADTGYYYFVLTDPDAGTHTFTKTFDEHKAANNLSTVSK